MNAIVPPLAAAGRLMLSLIFITSGTSKLGDLAGTASYIATAGLPAAGAVALGAGLLEVACGAALVVGFKARWAALALGIFTLLAALLFHPYWSVPADQQFVQQLFFMKNLAIAGGMFVVTALGGGPLSVDARRSSAC